MGALPPIPQQGSSSTGIDSSYFAYFAEHGSPTGLEFGHPKSGTTDDFTAAYNEMSWGDKNLDWIALDACQVLNNGTASQWSGAFKGLHAIYGFDWNSNADLIQYRGQSLRPT